YSSCLLVFFFFSSRRRHTRFSRDWSSDVCSSDLPLAVLSDLSRRIKEVPMDLLLDLIVTLSRWSRSHLYDISLAIMATLFVLFEIGRASCRERVWSSAVAVA